MEKENNQQNNDNQNNGSDGGNENLDNNNDSNKDEFDAASFLEDNDDNSNNNDDNNDNSDNTDNPDNNDGGADNNSDNNNQDNQDNNDNQDNDDEFSWDQLEDNQNQGDDNQDNNNDDNQDDNQNDNAQNDNQNDNNDNDNDDNSNNDNNDGGDNNQNQSSLNDAYLTVAKELGFKDESVEEFKKTLEEIQAENDRLKALELNSVDNEKIQTLSGLKKKTDEELYRLELKQQGFNDEEIQQQVDIATDNNTLKFEAKKIRNNIDRAITSEQSAALKSDQQAQAKQEQERQDAVNRLSDHIRSTDTMFGMKMAKDEATLSGIQNNHIEYITSGDFLGDVTKDEANLSEAAWLWKNRHIIQKALVNKGFNKGKKEVLDNIQEPDVSNTQRYRDPEGSDEFDVNKFVG